MGMKIKMKRDYKPTYRFGWMKKGLVYDVDKLPIDKEKAVSLVKSGYAEEVKALFGRVETAVLEPKKEKPVIVSLNEEKPKEDGLAKLRSEAKKRKVKVIEKEIEVGIPVEEDKALEPEIEIKVE
jgi:hypothetical protein